MQIDAGCRAHGEQGMHDCKEGIKNSFRDSLASSARLWAAAEVGRLIRSWAVNLLTKCTISCDIIDRRLLALPVQVEEASSNDRNRHSRQFWSAPAVKS